MSFNVILRRGLCAATGVSILLCGSAFAAEPTLGSANVATADPTVPRPPGKPCVVELFQNESFTNFSQHPYTYAPPAGCTGRWAKVVLEGDFSVSRGRQFDRTTTFWLGGVNLYFGTTQEPSSTLAPSWHVERDLTDYSALLRKPENGQAFIGNIVNDTYTGVISASARLLFYPASIFAPAPRVPDQVIPLGSDPIGSTVALNGSTDELARTVTLPRNVEHAFLDVFAQAQGADEFWYTCVPDQYAEQVQECGGGDYREAQISIDGQPAGVAPVTPWVYTGGIDPYLWRPTPGVQTLNFQPYRVDLSPFAGKLSDGAPHTVAVSVAGANNYFAATGALLIYRDPHTRQVTGRITRNTLIGQSPTPTIGDTLVTDANGNLSGDIITTLQRHFVIEGYANTSRGRITTAVKQTVGFDNTQSFTINDSTYRQRTVQSTTARSVSQRRFGPFLIDEHRENVRYPLDLDYNQSVAADGSGSVATAITLGYHKHSEQRLFGLRLYASSVDNTVESGDTLLINASGSITGHSGQHSQQRFDFSDSFGGCYRRAIASTDGVLTSDRAGDGCRHGRNGVFWFSHPDGSPYSLPRF